MSHKKNVKSKWMAICGLTNYCLLNFHDKQLYLFFSENKVESLLRLQMESY
jgi:hypothetical protein